MLRQQTLQLVDPAQAVLKVLATYCGSAAAPTTACTPPRYALRCTPGSGHLLNIVLQRYADPLAAQAAFAMARGSALPGTFHGYPRFATQAPVVSAPGTTRRSFSWLADAWVVRLEALDASAYWLPLSQYAEATFAAMLVHGLAVAAGGAQAPAF